MLKLLVVAALLLPAIATAEQTTEQTAAAEQTLSLTEAQHLAIERSRQLAAQDAAANANRELAVSAGQLPDPVLKLGVDNLPVEGTDRFSLNRDFMTMRRVGIMQEFTRSAKRELRAQIYQDEAEKNLAEKSVTIAVIQRDTALAWMERYYAELAAGLFDDQLNAIKLEITAAETAYKAGRGSQADVFATYSMEAALQDEKSSANRRVITAKNNLLRWVGEEANKVLADKPDFDSIQLDTYSLDNTLSHHPRIIALNKQEQIAESEAKLAEANKQADWSFEVAYQQRGSNFSDMISVGVSIPLQWDQKNRQNREVTAKLATIEQIKAERDEMLREHTTEINNLVTEWQSGRQRLNHYAQAILPLAAERTRATIVAYQTGKASLSDALSARRNEISTRQQAIQLEMETAKLWAQLNFLVPQSDATMHGATVKDAK